jgi:hypothetical protein
MIVVIGLIALITATVVALAGVAIESGSVRMLGSCTGRFTGSLDARGSPRALTRFAHETTALRVDRDRLTRQLAGERTPRPRGGIAQAWATPRAQPQQQGKRHDHVRPARTSAPTCLRAPASCSPAP